MARPAPTYPVFLVLPQVGERIATLLSTLEPLRWAIGAEAALAVDVYYRTSTDTALVALRFEVREATLERVTRLQEGAAQVGAALVDPYRLPEAGRRRFFDSYLPLYDVCFGGLDGPEQGLSALLRHLQGHTPIPSKPRAAERLEVRFRRGDEWQLARLRSITREGISVATATPPRQGDLVDVELSTSALSLVAKTSVVGVVMGGPAASLGAVGFGARFILAHESERRRLEEILALVGGDHAPPLDPPPYRRESRYPVRWPVMLRTPERKVAMNARDMSRRGMFVAGDFHDVESVHVTFPIDDRGTPILATARVARAIHDDTARMRGLSKGVGLEIVSLSSHDERRFHQFVGRIARRAEKEVVVGAAPDRLAALCGALSGAGYCAAGAADAPALIARAASAPRPPDLVVLDSSLPARALHAAQQALAVRRIPTLAIDGDSPVAAREHVDFALLS